MQNSIPLSRRRFIKLGTAGAAVAALTPGLLGAENKPKRRFKKGMMMNTFPGGKKNLTTLEQFKLLKEAGFDGAEPSSPMDLKDVLAARDATGLAIPSLCVGQGTRQMSSPNATERQQGTEALKRALREAKACGASSVLTVAGRVDASIAYDVAYGRIQEAIKAAVPLAEELGVKIAIENVWNNFLLSPLEEARFVDEFKSPAVGCYFDVGNVICNAWPEQWIRVLAQRIQSVHIKEFSRKKMNEQGLRKGFAVDYLEGDNDWPAVMKALDEVGYKGWCVAEPAWQPKGIEPGERLRQIAQAMDKIFGC